MFVRELIYVYSLNMKPIQVLIDEALLTELDADDEVRREGRSAVLRRAVRDYLKRRRRQSIARQYRNAYAERQGLGNEFEGWEKQGEWPPE
jgi:predicted transcriptional regulator